MIFAKKENNFSPTFSGWLSRQQDSLSSCSKCYIAHEVSTRVHSSYPEKDGVSGWKRRVQWNLLEEHSLSKKRKWLFEEGTGFLQPPPPPFFFVLKECHRMLSFKVFLACSAWESLSLREIFSFLFFF